MDMFQRILDRVMPRSAFGLTLLTISILILIVSFFVRGLHLVSIEGRPEDGSSALANNNNLIPWPDTSVRLGPGDSFRTGSAMRESATKSAGSFKGGSEDPASSAPVKPANRYADNPVRPKVAPGYVASLTRTCDCRWAEESENPKEGTQFKVGQTLNIAAGLAEIVFGCGAKAILEGPAILELESSKSGSLRVGKLTADVPDAVEGFTVHTPVVHVVSLCGLRPKGVAKLTATTDCLWAKGTAAVKEGGCLMPGQTVKLIGGLAEITFTSGAKVILQGPASLEIESAKSATLHNGRMTADVPDDLAGFKIRTSVVEILSLPDESKQAKDSQINADKRK